MNYAELTPAEQVTLAIEFKLRGAKVPADLEELVGPSVMDDINNPESNNEQRRTAKSG